MQRTVGTARVSEHVLSTMATEAERAYPNETGGVLLGYWATPHSEVVVTAVVGPGPRAIHEPTRFIPDADYHRIEIAHRYLADSRRTTYLGDWHSHPQGGAKLSSKDRKTLLQIATFEAARAPVPLMAILTLEAEWQVMVWRFDRSIFKLFGYRGRTRVLQLPCYIEGTEAVREGAS